METFQENRRKPTYWLILALFGSKNGPKIWPTGRFFTHTWKYPQCVCTPSFMVSYWNVFEKMAKTFKFPPFYIFIVIKDPLKKLEAKNKNSTSATFDQYCCAHSSQTLERLDENRGSLFDLKKRGWRTDWRTARHLVSSADYVSSEANRILCISSGTYCISIRELIHKKIYLWYKIYFLSLSRQMVIWLSRGQHQRPRSLGTTPVSEWISQAT